jgi:hypothetical protein
MEQRGSFIRTDFPYDFPTEGPTAASRPRNGAGLEEPLEGPLEALAPGPGADAGRKRELADGGDGGDDDDDDDDAGNAGKTGDDDDGELEMTAGARSASLPTGESSFPFVTSLPPGVGKAPVIKCFR